MTGIFSCTKTSPSTGIYGSNIIRQRGFSFGGGRITVRPPRVWTLHGDPTARPKPHTSVAMLRQVDSVFTAQFVHQTRSGANRRSEDGCAR